MTVTLIWKMSQRAYYFCDGSYTWTFILHVVKLFWFVQAYSEKSHTWSFNVWLHTLTLYVGLFPKSTCTLISHVFHKFLIYLGGFWEKRYMKLPCMNSCIDAPCRKSPKIHPHIDFARVQKNFDVCRWIWEKSYMELHCMKSYIVTPCIFSVNIHLDIDPTRARHILKKS